MSTSYQHKAGDLHFLKRLNRSAILELVRRTPGLTRADIATEAQLTKATVGACVQSLLQHGWLREGELQKSSGGRPGRALHLNEERHVLFGAEVGVHGLRLMACTLAGQVLASHHEHLAPTTPEVTAELLGELLGKLMDEAPIKGRLCLGLGVALPGPIAPNKPVLRLAPNLGWRDVRFLDAADPSANTFHVTDEFSFRARPDEEAIRFDVAMLINGIPIILIETKSAHKRDGVAEAMVQIRRYHGQGPEALALLQLFGVTHIHGFKYGATWNTSHKALYDWREEAQGDYEAARQLFEDYGIHFDAKLRDEVVARVEKLNLPSYTGFVMPKLDPVRDASGVITDIAISYPEMIQSWRPTKGSPLSLGGSWALSASNRSIRINSASAGSNRAMILFSSSTTPAVSPSRPT